MKYLDLSRAKWEWGMEGYLLLEAALVELSGAKWS